MITILAPQLSISETAYLGGAVTDREVLTNLAKRGYHIKVLLPEGETYKPVENMEVIYLKRNFLLNRSYLCNLFFLKEIRKMIKAGGIDILRVHSPYSIGLGVSFLKMFTRKMPKIWFSFLHLEDRWDWHLFDKVLPAFADGITALSTDTMNELKSRYGGLDKKVNRVTPLGVDTGMFRKKDNPSLDELPDVDITRPIVLFVGSLIKRKGIDILLKSWVHVKEEVPQAQLVIVGQGPSEYMVTDFMKGKKDIFLLNFLSHERLVDYYSAASVFAFPSRKEGFGLVVSEAMSCSLPVVAHNASGVKRLIEDGISGFLVHNEDINAFSNKIIYLLTNELLASKMGHSASKRINEIFSWDLSIRQTQEFISELIERPER